MTGRAAAIRDVGRHPGSNGVDTHLLLEGEGLTKRYGGVVALSEVALTLKAGEILGLVGPNGAGKTTLVDLITGAQTATAGTIRLGGRSLKGSPAKRARMGLARTFQHPLLAPELSVMENLVAGVAACRFGTVLRMAIGVVRGLVASTGSDYLQAAQLAAELGISDLDRLASDLTLGEQRLIEVGRALAQNPEVMLLDEPFAGADGESVARMIDGIRSVQDRGHGVILVDHNVDLISLLADRVMLLDRGRVVFDGKPADCLASREMKDVYFGGNDDG